MANICTSYLYVTGPESRVQEFMRAALEKKSSPAYFEGKVGRSLSFAKLVQPPPGADRKWCTDNWGCQCEASSEGIMYSGNLLNSKDYMASYAMETDWSPPIGVLRSASEQYPELLFVMDYEEDSYFGRCRFKAGKGLDVTLDRQGPVRGYYHIDGF